MKVDNMVKHTAEGFYTNAMFSEAEAIIREEQERMREQGEADGQSASTEAASAGEAAFNTLQQVLEDSRQILVAANMQPDDPFPMDDKIKEAYSHVVENTAFFGDVALRFPRIVHHYFDRNSEWGGLLRWGLHFCNQTGVLTGGAHQHVLTLMSQELGITEKTPDFMNPYRTERDDVLHTAEAFKKILREEEKRRRKEERGKKSFLF
ncbi:Coiled-coil domain-containing protein 134 [Takifugu flavidus]|uniref:Coiled-coil domain-containing protein 134 n=2 Tax=Takifugu flavidus TaxID=433684 RepID=A0A5C6NPQ6_9TELE|nr:Coiled-coil domain-containing protein 134 [Takifugu flavidus]